VAGSVVFALGGLSWRVSCTFSVGRIHGVFTPIALNIFSGKKPCTSERFFLLTLRFGMVTSRFRYRKGNLTPNPSPFRRGEQKPPENKQISQFLARCAARQKRKNPP
jgi:hypothetical protein